MGDCWSHSAVCPVQRRPLVARLRMHSRWLWIDCHRNFLGRDGLHVSLTSLAHFETASHDTDTNPRSDPTVGAQYRWSARFAQRWPEFWGLMQGMSCHNS